MIVITTKRSVRKPADSFVNLSRMDYELVCNILQLLEETGMEDEELSFLLGKRNKYFFDVIDPRKKQKLKTDLSDPLAAIFGTGHRNIHVSIPTISGFNNRKEKLALLTSESLATFAGYR